MALNKISFTLLAILLLFHTPYTKAKEGSCSYSRFYKIVAKSKKALSTNPYSIYFYEAQEASFAREIEGFALTDGKIYIDTRGGDLYSLKFKYDSLLGGFRLRSILYRTFIDSTAIIFPKYNSNCNELESILLVTKYDQFGNLIPEKYHEFTRKKKCRVKVSDSSYGWADC